MKVRITILTENDEPLPTFDERPSEELVKEAWQNIFDMLGLLAGDSKGIVEKVDFVEEVQE